MSKLDESQYASKEEARSAINDLSDLDYVKLMKVAQHYANKCGTFLLASAEDLLQEAVVRTLDGSRKWRKAVSLLTHLTRAIESVSGHIAGKIKTRREEPLNKKNTGHLPTPPHSSASQNNIGNDDILRVFADDEQATNIIHLKAQGYKASEVISMLQLSKRDYDTAMKRISRRIFKHISSEYESHATK